MVNISIIYFFSWDTALEQESVYPDFREITPQRILPGYLGIFQISLRRIPRKVSIDNSLGYIRREIKRI